LVSLIAGSSNEKHEELTEATKTWSEVDIKISINGIDVPYDHFFKSVESNMKWWAEKKATSMMEDVMDGLREEVDKVEDVLKEASEHIKSRLQKELGIEFPED
jgi:hypothetical protein